MNNVVIRVDASLEIGSGHVMRCLTLADTLKAQGAEIVFICRKLPGNLIYYIESKCYKVYSLELDGISDRVISKEDNNIAHSHWLGVDQLKDAEQCRGVLEKLNTEWLIVDHYAIDYRWQEQIRDLYKSLMVIDDLADRKHESDVLLDQTFGRKNEDYNSLVPRKCQLLLGSKYALLRPEFFKWRQYSLQRRIAPEIKNILITMGGVDKENVTGEVLEELKACVLPEELTITVVIGAKAPNIEKVKKIALSMTNKTEVKVSITNMAELMANTDLAIGAAGSTTWERCCLGLPSIQMIIAENQKSISINLSSVNSIECIDDISDLQLSLKNIVEWYRKISFIASSITDGNGCERVSDYMLSKTVMDEEVTLKAANIDDCEYVYGLQTDEARRYSRNPAKPTREEHVRWFMKTIKSKDSVLFITMLNQQSAGILRFDNINSKEIEVSIIVAPKFSGLGVAKKSLTESFKLQPGRCFKAVIHKENFPSQKVFEKIGFNKVGEAGHFVQYTKHN